MCDGGKETAWAMTIGMRRVTLYISEVHPDNNNKV